jgi:ArsR family transcriptional regulator, arsenate/arsenite/antimonite-responsive transcriptional repressor / arsenate reductase (thioredoxin)
MRTRSGDDLQATPGGGASAAPIRVLFLCWDNSARSPMAEAILRSLGRPHFAAYSAGVKPAHAVDPHALSILEERGLPVDGLTPKGLEAFEGQSFDYVVSLADPAREQAPNFKGADVMHWSFVDPERSLEDHKDPHPYEHLFAELNQRIRLLLITAERSEREARLGTPT